MSVLCRKREMKYIIYMQTQPDAVKCYWKRNIFNKRFSRAEFFYLIFCWHNMFSVYTQKHMPKPL